MAVIFEFRSIYSVSVFLLTFNLFLFNADVNWLPSPLWLSQATSNNFTFNISVVVICF